MLMQSGRFWNTIFLTKKKAFLLPAMASTRPLPSPAQAGRRLAAIIHHLRQYTPGDKERRAFLSQLGDLGPSQSRRAAVLVCLFEGRAGELRVILTKRSSRLSSHSGEVSLPGGKAEEGDVDDVATALREAKEEIGLDPSLVTVATVMEPILSKHLLSVVPVIGILADRKAFKPVANADEVEVIFDAPMEMFLKDENRICKEIDWQGTKRLLHYFTYESEKGKYTVWGSTAEILIRAASIVYQRPPSFAMWIPS